MKTLSLELWQNLSRYPLFRFHADQWGEHGWVYCPHADRYVNYAIDRKDQYDEVYHALTWAEFREHVRPSAEPALRDWFDRFTTARTETDAYILQSDGTLRRYPLGELPRDRHGAPQQEVVVLLSPADVPTAARLALGITG